MSAIAFIGVSVIWQHHTGDSPKTGLPRNNSTKNECTGFTSLYRIWLNLILHYVSFQRIGLTFIAKGLPAITLSHQNYIKTSFLEKLENLLLLGADYSPLMSSIIKPAQEVDTRNKIKKMTKYFEK